MHSSEQAGVLFIMELYGDITITTTTLTIKWHWNSVLMLPYQRNALFT
jgi:hypothetical protein